MTKPRLAARSLMNLFSTSRLPDLPRVQCLPALIPAGGLLLQSDAGSDGQLSSKPLGLPANAAFEAIFLAKVRFAAREQEDSESFSLLDKFRKDHIIFEFQEFSRQGLVQNISPRCQVEFSEMLINALSVRPLKLSDEVQTDGYKISVGDKRWPQTLPYYELLRDLVRSCTDFAPFPPRLLRRLMERTQSSDTRERTAAAELLHLYYERRLDGRADFLPALETILVDLREGCISPCAGPPLLECLARAIEANPEGQESEFKELITVAVIPLVNHHLLGEFVPAMSAVFVKFMAQCPVFGVHLLYAIQRNWPLSTRAAAVARLTIAVFCALDRQYASALAPSFFDFLADCLSSPESLLVAAALEIFDRADGVELISMYPAEAIGALYAPLVSIQNQMWQYKSSVKTQLCLDALAKADPQQFERMTLRDSHDLVPPNLRQERWDAILAMAEGRAELVETGSRIAVRGVAQVTKIVTAQDRSQAILGRSRQRSRLAKGSKLQGRPGVASMVMLPLATRSSRIVSPWPYSIRAIGGIPKPAPKEGPCE